MKVNKSETIDLKEKLNQEKPSREQAMDAVKTLISWAGDNPLREGLLDTPQRVVKAYEEFFSGYDPSFTQKSKCNYRKIQMSKVQKKNANDKFFLQSGLVVTNFIERFIGCTLQSQIFTAF